MNFSNILILVFSLVIIIRIIRAIKSHFEQTKYFNTPFHDTFGHSYTPTKLNLTTEQLEKCKDCLNTVILATQQILDKAVGTEHAATHRILRQTNPTFNSKPLYVFQDDLKEADLTSELIEPQEYQSLLDLKFNGHNNIKNIDGKGKIIGFTIGITTIDGAPIAESHGFVDTYDIPPYDTWFYLYKDILLCWIPEEYLSLMQKAIEVEIFGSYFWLEEKYPNINDHLLSNKHTID